MANYMEEIRPDDSEMPEELEGAFEEIDGEPDLMPETEDDETVEGETEEVTEEETEEETEGVEAQPEPEAKSASVSQAEYNRLAANHRIMARDQAILVERLAALERGIPRRGEDPKKVEEPEEEIPSFEEDQAAHLKGRLDRLETERKREEEAAKVREREYLESIQFREDTEEATREIHKFREQNPEEYQGAVNHLMGAWMSEALQRNPGIPSSEIERELAAAVVRTSVRLHKQGKNPGEYFYGQAVQRGWSVGAATQQGQAEGKREGKKLNPGKYGEGVAKVEKATPKQEIQGQLAKAKTARTLSAVGSSGAAKRPNLSTDLHASEDDWDSRVSGRTSRQLLAGLGKEGVGD